MLMLGKDRTYVSSLSASIEIIRDKLLAFLEFARIRIYRCLVQSWEDERRRLWHLDLTIGLPARDPQPCHGILETGLYRLAVFSYHVVYINLSAGYRPDSVGLEGHNQAVQSTGHEKFLVHVI